MFQKYIIIHTKVKNMVKDTIDEKKDLVFFQTQPRNTQSNTCISTQ